MAVGIEAINFYAGAAYIDVKKIFEWKNLDLERFDNLMMEKKSVGLPCEDPVSLAVNAAKPILDRLTAEEKDSIELLVTASESGLDFGKSISNYVHKYLELSKKCKAFEVKQACFGGTAAFSIASNYVGSCVKKGTKALVIATDIPKKSSNMSGYAETSQGIGAVAMLVSENPKIMQLDYGAYGVHSYEVMDTFRPLPDIEYGNSDLSLLSYLDCLKESYKAYCERVEDVDLRTTFDYFAFHTPFGGAAKGGHRKLMREFCKMSRNEIEEDFQKRLAPSLKFCVEVGNVYSATTYLALCGLVDSIDTNTEKRVGMYSYGSGCCSEFYSGIILPGSKTELSYMKIEKQLNDRYELSVEEHEDILRQNESMVFGIKDFTLDTSPYQNIFDQMMKGKGRLILDKITQYHREYKWV